MARRQYDLPVWLDSPDCILPLMYCGPIHWSATMMMEPRTDKTPFYCPSHHPPHLQITGSARAAAVLAEFKARRIPAGGPRGMAAQAAALIAQHSLDDTLYIYDLGNTMRLFKAWRAAMPRVIPYYAVKCNPEPALLKLLAALGAGFDCASKAELETVLGLGVTRDR